ncbi:MAG: AraC family transcriptional regulator [Nocardioides sp.]|uniref:helix-turn-helix transcriptional regulator n=1 Tax=Nocardioides sp. TaxID=35761 RepID=UPI0039E4444E
MIDPPPIPRMRADESGLPRGPLLLWVRTGTAHVQLDDAAPHRLDRGQGIWVPADGWRMRVIATEPGTVAFPLFPQATIGSGAPSSVTRFEVPDGWQDWLIQHFNLQVTPYSAHGYPRGAIADLLRPSRSHRGVVESQPSLSAPALPKTPSARAVADELLRDPALDFTVEQWATRVLCSARSLRRAFLGDTGLTFEQWRLGCRLSAAVELLAAGYDVEQVATRVGFAGRNGLTRAFKHRFGQTPREFGRQLQRVTAGGPSTLGERATAARQTDAMVSMVRPGADRAAPELLPATSTPPHSNDFHVLTWVYRGSGYLDIGSRRYERERGVATWIPAGADHVTALRENSVSLPLGDAGTDDLTLSEPLQVRFPPSWDDYLMSCSISARSALRPAGHDQRHILSLFAEQVAAQRALSVPMPTHPHARAAAMDYLRTVGTTRRSSEPGLPPEVHRAFRDETGMTFARWRYAARMRVARDLLAGGARPSVVARRVGYAHLPTFSTAFARFHGVSPRDYQEERIETA